MPIASETAEKEKKMGGKREGEEERGPHVSFTLDMRQGKEF